MVALCYHLMRRSYPSYPLSLIHDAVRNGRYLITYAALQGASKLGLGLDDLVTCVLEITDHDFFMAGVIAFAVRIKTHN